MPSTTKADKRGKLLPSDIARITEAAQEFIRGCHRWERTTGSENHITSITLYPPSQSRNGQWLVIAKAWSGGYRLVAFSRSTDPLHALALFFTRWVNGKLEWKEDKYAERFSQTLNVAELVGGSDEHVTR